MAAAYGILGGAGRANATAFALPERLCDAWIAAAALLALTCGCSSLCRTLPPGTAVRGSVLPASATCFRRDLTYTDAAGQRQCDQMIFADILGLIATAKTFVVVDMFLYNDWRGDGGAPYRPLSREFTEALLAKRRNQPDCRIVLITDPINRAYGGARAPHLEALRQAGVTVVETDLDQLRDSNALYSFWWRLLIRPFGNAPHETLPNPFGAGKVSLRTYLRLLNFKANHRKVVIADPDGIPTALVTSANPHDGSSAHSNAAVSFRGPAVAELLDSELAVAAFSGCPVVPPIVVTGGATAGEDGVTAQVVTERRIAEAVLQALADAAAGDEADLVMFYLSDRAVIRALIAAQQRGVRLRLVLDPNKDAFGRQKGGIPNRQVAAELHGQGLPLRWYDTHGEQCHTKMLLVRYAHGGSTLITGSANLTRRNLDDYNLETDVVLRGPGTASVFQDAQRYVDAIWANTDGRQCTVDYERYRDPSCLKYWRYRFMEASGFSTF